MKESIKWDYVKIGDGTFLLPVAEEIFRRFRPRELCITVDRGVQESPAFRGFNERLIPPDIVQFHRTDHSRQMGGQGSRPQNTAAMGPGYLGAQFLDVRAY